MWGEDTGFFVHEDAWGGMAVRAGFRSRGRKHWVFAHEDAQVGGEAQLRGHATRGSAPSAALGRLETEPPLRVTASAAEITSSPRSITAEKPSLEQPLHELMTFVMCRS